jgi:hypothetical protein
MMTRRLTTLAALALFAFSLRSHADEPACACPRVFVTAHSGKEAVFIVPVDEAVFALRERVADGKAPGISKQSELFRDDLGHPNAAIAILVTYCHFVAIHHRSPVGLPVPAELKDQPQAEALNHLLQLLAWNAVTTYPHSGVKATAGVSQVSKGA